MPSPVADLLSDLGAGLSEIGAPWYLFGARAAILYGVARLTADVDVTVRLSDSTTGDMLAGRPKDQEDVVAIAAAHGTELDERAIHRTLATLEEALAQNDLVPAFDAALARARRARPPHG